MREKTPVVLHFHKYTATGNDFILIDDRDERFPTENSSLIRRLCDRRFGIGADGLILLQHSPKTAFRMRYFNRDGLEAEMCGNGARSVVHFAGELGIVNGTCEFESMLAVHQARFHPEAPSVRLNSPTSVRFEEPAVPAAPGAVLGYVEIGVPHLVIEVDDLDGLDVPVLGARLAHDPVFPKGANVDFVQLLNGKRFKMRTFERGVEAETLSCGTGAAASALLVRKLRGGKFPARVHVRGGELQVSGAPERGELWLTGPVEHLFRGEWLANSGRS